VYPNWGLGADYALRWGVGWGLTQEVILSVMQWARDADLNPQRSPAHGSLIEEEFANRTGRSTDELDAAAPVPEIPGGGRPPTRLYPILPGPTTSTGEVRVATPASTGQTPKKKKLPTAAALTAGRATFSFSPLLFALVSLPLAYAGYKEYEAKKKR